MRLRTLRSTYWLIGLAILLSAGVAFIAAFATRNDSDAMDPDVVGTVLFGGGSLTPFPFIAIFMAIVGIFATGHEYRHSTIQPTLTAIPQRSTVLGAKVIMVAAVSAIVTVVSVVVNGAVGLIYWGELPDLSAPLDEAIAGYVVFVVIYALSGLALAQLFRGVPSALVFVLVFPLVIESLVAGLSMLSALDWLEPALKFLPYAAGSRLFATEPYDPQGGPDFDFLDRWASGGVFAAFVAIVLAVAWYLFKKRDA
ncbi:ABC transporter permease subunit [Jiangella alkaliphila]|uniref:ABC transporter permease subunit n=1 Tax=Jiangella alkaliphila TaxID=419479 RepID=UPI0009F70791|nr:ABC transporter permease subunit [Jiangella alkaliphila]